VASVPVERHDGWIVIRLAGTPREIGYQHGLALAADIDDAIRVVKFEMKQEQPVETRWEFFRAAAERVSWPRVPREYQEEIEGIARGVQDAGYDYDWKDILMLNASIELPGYWWPVYKERVSGVLQASGAPQACSAFVATGSATADHGIVMGQNFWWGYLTGQRFNVMFCVTPEHGRAFVMDGMPGFIHSGTDFAINDAEMMLCETTISGFKGYDENGVPEFVRMRRAMQYGDSLDSLIGILKEGNNGGYANAWLIGDGKTNEIAKVEMGLLNVVVSRTFDGFYFGANVPEDPRIVAECPGQTPGATSARLERWKQVLEANRGKVDVMLAQSFLGDTTHATNGKRGASGDTLCGRSDLDPGRGFRPGGAVSNRVTNSAMAKELELWAKWGFADGSRFDASDYFRGRSSRASGVEGVAEGYCGGALGCGEGWITKMNTRQPKSTGWHVSRYGETRADVTDPTGAAHVYRHH